MEFIHQILDYQPLIALFVTIALGYFVGKLKIGNFVLGGIARTLLGGVGIGQFGITLDSGIKGIFFVLFIYALGFQGGPQFFHANVFFTLWGPLIVGIITTSATLSTQQ